MSLTVVETFFALIIYQFYQELSECIPVVRESKQPPIDPPLLKVVQQPKEEPQPKAELPPESKANTVSPCRSYRSYRCNILQTNADACPNTYTCGPMQKQNRSLNNAER